MSDTSKLVVFLDAIGRTIIAVREDETDEILKAKNPAVVNIVQQPGDNRMALQLFPIFFKEFLAEKEEPVIFNYRKNGITMSEDMALNFKVGMQYEQLFSKTGEVVTEPPATASQPPSPQQVEAKEPVPLFND